MFTDCPACQRQFRLSARHLSAAAGQVCCGFCGARFNALERLRDAPMQSSAVMSPVPEPEPAEPEFDISLPAHQPVTPNTERPRWTPVPETMDTEQVDSPGRGWRWTAVAVLLLMFGAGQVAWFQRDDILQRYPVLVPHVERLCQQLGCVLLRQRDLAALTVLNRDVRAHPRYQDALLVNATISNSAGTAQPFPRIQLALSDSNGKIIAARSFAPAEYLDGSIDQQHGMTPGAPVHVVLEIVGVGAEAVSFEIGFM